MNPLSLPVPRARTGALRACMLAYTFYENDARVMRYAEALARDGAQVDAIVLRRPGQPVEELLNGVRVLRVQLREKNERGRYSYLARILRFFMRSMVEVARRHLQQPYDLVHVHSVPDFEVFAAWLPRLAGARVILDIHDIVPEFYASKFHVEAESSVFRALLAAERWSARFADHVIVANDLWLERIAQRAAPRAKCTAFINYPDLKLFHPRPRTPPTDDRFTVCYPGTLNWHQGLDIAIRAVALALPRAPGLRLLIHGEGSSRPALVDLTSALGLQDHVQLRAPMPLREIAGVMADVDLGVVPKRAEGFGNEAMSTKILEFMALGVPVVAAETQIDRRYFDDSLLRFFTAGDEHALAEALVAEYHDRAGAAARATRALAHARANSWDLRQRDYLALVKGLIRGHA